MALRRKQDGSFTSITSESDARLARKRIDALQDEVLALAKKVGIPAKLDEQVALQNALNEYVLDREYFESDEWTATRVQAHSRSWDAEKLRKLLPTSVYKSIIRVSIDNDKVNEFVKAGTIKLKTIESAFMEKANKPFVRWTAKGRDVQTAGEAEASKLAGMLS